MINIFAGLLKYVLQKKLFKFEYEYFNINIEVNI